MDAARHQQPARRTPPARLPLPTRKRAERQAARARIAARTRRPLTAEQRARDSLSARPSGGRRLLYGAAALLGSAGLHVLVVVIGIAVGGMERGRREAITQTVKVEVRERPLPPPPPPPPPPEEVVPEPQKPAPVVEPPKPRPKVAKAAPPPPDPTPPPPTAEPPPKAPPRVVGLSLDSTVEGGNGPAFAVGNTRMGETAERAAAPKEVPPVAGDPLADPAPGTNRVATRLPTAGVKYTQPKRKRPVRPLYPETLKSQGLEADVTVMVNVDASGKVTNVKIIRPATYPEFNEAARQTALAEEFEPATRDGVPIPFTVSYTYKFELEEQ